MSLKYVVVTTRRFFTTISKSLLPWRIMLGQKSPSRRKISPKMKTTSYRPLILTFYDLKFFIIYLNTHSKMWQSHIFKRFVEKSIQQPFEEISQRVLWNWWNIHVGSCEARVAPTIRPMLSADFTFCRQRFLPHSAAYAASAHDTCEYKVHL